MLNISLIEKPHEDALRKIEIRRSFYELYAKNTYIYIYIYIYNVNI